MKLAALLLALVATSAQAEFLDGNMLLSRMTGSPSDQVNALGYVAGVGDALYGIHWCPPGNVTTRQAHDLTKQLLETLPSLRQEPADVFVRAALKRAFPCQTAKPATLGAAL